MRPSNSLIISSGTAGTASVTSQAVWATDIIRACFQVVVSSGSMVGTFQLQASNDQSTGAPANQFVPTNWNVVGSASSVTGSSTATSKAFLSVPVETCYEYLRVVYSDGSAAAAIGVFNVRLVAKGL